jgi:hypothetical protein
MGGTGVSLTAPCHSAPAEGIGLSRAHAGERHDARDSKLLARRRPRLSASCRHEGADDLHALPGERAQPRASQSQAGRRDARGGRLRGCGHPERRICRRGCARTRS